MFFKTNYIWTLLRYVTFHVQVEIGLYVMSLTLKSFNRPFMRLWNCAAFIQIEFGSSVRSYASCRHRRKSCVLFTYLWIQYKKKKYKRKERSIKSISTGESEAWKQVSSSSIPLRYFCVLLTPIHEAKQNIRSDVQMCRCSMQVLSM